MIVSLDKNVADPTCCQQLKKAFATTTDPKHLLPKTIDELDIPNLIRDQEISQNSSFQ